MKYTWLSFSKDGVNQGCCNVEASSESEALEKCKDLGISPDYDDLLSLRIPEPELPLDELISRDHMNEGGWHTINGGLEKALVKRAETELLKEV